MKTIKRTIAVLIALATILSCFAVMAGAITTSDILKRLSVVDSQGVEYYHSTDRNRLGNLKPGSYFQNGECWQYVLGLSKYIMGKGVSIPTTPSYLGSGRAGDYDRVQPTLRNCSYDQIVNLLKQSQPGDIIGFYNSCVSQTFGHIMLIGNNSNGKLTLYQAASGTSRKDVINLSAEGLRNLYSFGYGGRAHFYSNSYGICLFRHKDFSAHTHTKGEYVYNWAAHPHYSCYKCSVCGEIWEDKSTAKYSASCSECSGEDPIFDVTGATKPTAVKLGTCFGLKGKITCNKKITDVTAGIYTDSKGKNAVQKISVKPNSTSYDLYGKVNDSLIFNNLKKGTYYYRVTVTAKGTSKTLINKKFTVVPSITISGETKPTSVTKGNCFGLRGTISDVRKMTNVTAGIYTDSNGKNAKQKVSVNPNASSYNLNGKVNNELIFNYLPKGTYYYRVTAADSYGTEILINQKFTVK